MDGGVLIEICNIIRDLVLRGGGIYEFSFEYDEFEVLERYLKRDVKEKLIVWYQRLGDIWVRDMNLCYLFIDGY